MHRTPATNKKLARLLLTAQTAVYREWHCLPSQVDEYIAIADKACADLDTALLGAGYEYWRVPYTHLGNGRKAVWYHAKADDEITLNCDELDSTLCRRSARWADIKRQAMEESPG